MSALSNRLPSDYQTPSWPSLYWPTKHTLTDTTGSNGPGSAYYLYRRRDIFLFTLYWTLLIYGVVHLLTASYAMLMQYRGWRVRRRATARSRNGQRRKDDWWKTVWVIPVVYLVIGGIEAVVTGCVVGAILGVVYNAGYFHMSTWLPFIWGLVNVMILILASFAIQGGL